MASRFMTDPHAMRDMAGAGLPADPEQLAPKATAAYAFSH